MAVDDRGRNLLGILLSVVIVYCDPRERRSFPLHSRVAFPHPFPLPSLNKLFLHLKFSTLVSDYYHDYFCSVYYIIYIHITNTRSENCSRSFKVGRPSNLSTYCTVAWRAPYTVAVTSVGAPLCTVSNQWIHKSRCSVSKDSRDCMTSYHNAGFWQFIQREPFGNL